MMRLRRPKLALSIIFPSFSVYFASFNSFIRRHCGVVYAKEPVPSDSVSRWPDQKWLKDIVERQDLIDRSNIQDWWVRAQFSGKGYLKDDDRIFTKYYWDPLRKHLVGYVEWGMDVEGPPNCVHGGCIAAVCDECFGRTVSASIPETVFVTVNLSVNYKKFIPLNSITKIEGSVEHVDGRKVFLKGKIFDPLNDQVYVECSAIFLTIQDNQVFKQGIINHK